MPKPNLTQNSVVRTKRGLTIDGTRLTLYDIMDYVTQNWSAEQIKDWFELTDKQITDVMNYISEHREQVEQEYQQVLEYAEEIRQYWEEYNREHLARARALPPKPGREEIWAKLQAAKAKLGIE